VNILHETPTATNPLASTVLGSVLAHLVSALVIVTPAILLTKISGTRLASIYLDRHRIWRGLRIALIGFTVFYFLTFFGLLQTLFPNSAVTPLRFLALSPAILILVLSNGLREEVWFRGLFLKKYGKFLSPLSSNMVQASVFASFHFQVQYTPYLLGFLGITFILGLWLGHMMQATGNILAPAVFHAGADIPIYAAFLSYAQ